MRYVLVFLTLAAAIAFVVSVAISAKWIGSSSGAPHTSTATRTTKATVVPPTAKPRPITAYYFAGPDDVKVSPSGHVFVADTLNNRVVELGRPGTQFESWGSHAIHRATMHNPSRVLPLRNGFAIIDDLNTRVATFALSGKRTASWAVSRTLGEVTGPTALALSPGGDIYLADGNNDRVIRLSATGSALQSWNTKGFLASAQGGPNDPGFPAGLAIDPAGKIYVSYPNAGVVQKFSTGGTPIDKWTLPGRGAAATDVAVDHSGNVYVVDNVYNRVAKFSAAGPLLATWGGSADGKSTLIHPTAIAVDTHGHVFVSDAGNAKAGSFVKEWTTSGKFVHSFAYG